MNEPESLLRLLSPPGGGWQRLLARRDAAPRWARQWLPLAAGGALTLLLLAIVVPQPELRISWPGTQNESAGGGVVPLDRQRVTSLPTDDPRVQLYWMEAAPTLAAPPER